MRHVLLSSFAVVLLAGAAVAQTAPLGRPPEVAGPRTGAATLSYLRMIKVLPDLTAAQKEPLKQAADAADAELFVQSQALMQKIQKIQTTPPAAGNEDVEPEDMQKVMMERHAARQKVMETEFKAFMVEQTRTQGEYDAKVAATLTPAQRLTWESYKLERQVDGLLAAAAPTEEQKVKIAGLVKEATQAIVAAPDAAAANVLRGQTVKKIMLQVFSDEQAAKYLPAFNPAQDDAVQSGGALRGPGK